MHEYSNNSHEILVSGRIHTPPYRSWCIFIWIMYHLSRHRLCAPGKPLSSAYIHPVWRPTRHKWHCPSWKSFTNKTAIGKLERSEGLGYIVITHSVASLQIPPSSQFRGRNNKNQFFYSVEYCLSPQSTTKLAVLIKHGKQNYLFCLKQNYYLPLCRFFGVFFGDLKVVFFFNLLLFPCFFLLLISYLEEAWFL